MNENAMRPRTRLRSNLPELGLEVRAIWLALVLGYVLFPFHKTGARVITSPQFSRRLNPSPGPALPSSLMPRINANATVNSFPALLEPPGVGVPLLARPLDVFCAARKPLPFVAHLQRPSPLESLV